MHYLHRYLVKLDNVEGMSPDRLKETAVSEVRDFLDAERERLSCDYYAVGEDFSWGSCPPCISAAEVGPEEFFRLIAEAVAAREKKVAFYTQRD